MSPLVIQLSLISEGMRIKILCPSMTSAEHVAGPAVDEARLCTVSVSFLKSTNGMRLFGSDCLDSTTVMVLVLVETAVCVEVAEEDTDEDSSPDIATGTITCPPELPLTDTEGTALERIYALRLFTEKNPKKMRRPMTGTNPLGFVIVLSFWEIS